MTSTVGRAEAPAAAALLLSLFDASFVRQHLHDEFIHFFDIWNPVLV